MKIFVGSSSRRRGFTLIEVMMAVLILAMLAGVGAISFRKPLQRAKGIDAVQRVKFLDESSRTLARKQGKSVAMEIDPAKGTLVRLEGEKVSFRSPAIGIFEYPNGHLASRQAPAQPGLSHSGFLSPRQRCCSREC